MSEVNLGRVRGNMWYAGDKITGIGSNISAPNSGITAAYVGDMYLNTGSGTYLGSVYQCTTAGGPDAAKWKNVGSIKTPLDLVDGLVSTSTVKGLTANQGRVLRELIESSGVFPKTVYPGSDETSYTASVTVPFRATVITITVTTADDETGEYSFTPSSGSGSTVTATFAVGSEIGLSTTGAVIARIDSTLPIYEYHLYDSNTDEIAGGVPDLWETVLNTEDNVQAGTSITDGSETVKSGIISKIINGVRSVLWPVTHAKAVWFDKSNNVTVHDKIGTTAMGTTATSLTGAAAELGSAISALSSGKVAIEFSEEARTGGYTAYWKFSDGTLICAKSITASVTCSSSWGALYYSSQVSLGSWAKSFTATPYIQVSLRGSDAILMSVKSASSTRAGTVGLVRGTSSTADATIQVLAIGRWS